MQMVSQLVLKFLAIIIVATSGISFSAVASSAVNEGEIIEVFWLCSPEIDLRETAGAVFEAGKVGYTFTPSLHNGVSGSCSDLEKKAIEQSGYQYINDVKYIFANKYVRVYWADSGLFSSTHYSGTLEEFLAYLRSGSSISSYEFKITPQFDLDQKRIEEKKALLEKEKEVKRIEEKRKSQEEAKIREAELAAQAAAKAAAIAADEATRKAKAEAMKVRVALLKDGTVAISSFDDALLKLEPSYLWPIMKAPLIKPDRKLYTEQLDIDSAQGENLIFAKGGMQSALEFVFLRSQRIGGDEINYSYAALRMSNKTKYFSQSGLRLGQRIVVIGKYVANREFMSESGVKTIPELEVIYVDIK